MSELNAYYDDKTHKIMGAKRGSFVYWHEYRHAWQDKRGFTSAHDLYLYPTGLLLALITGVTGFAGVAFAIVLALASFWLGFELDAHFYALRKTRGWAHEKL